jgi:hypothetical protein
MSLGSPRPFVLAKCVWGEAYVDTMLSFNIPSLLSAQNAGALGGGDVEHRVYTTAADRERIEAAPTYRRLASTVRCTIVVPDLDQGFGGISPYETTIARMNAYHHRIVDDCAAAGAFWLFDQPDHFWGDGSIGHLIARAEAGCDVVCFSGVRTEETGISDALSARRDPDSGAIEVSNRDLVGLAIEHLHFHDATRFWGPPISTDWPHHVALRVTADCFIRRCFYPQPYLMRVSDSLRFERSVDESYIESAMAAGYRVEFVGDTDDFFVLEMSGKYQFPSYSVGRLSAGLVGNWALRHAADAHYQAFSRSIVYHSGEIPRRRLRHVERLARSIDGTIRKMRDFDRLAGSIAVDHPMAEAFVRLCLNDNDLLRNLRVPDSFKVESLRQDGVPDLVRAACAPSDRDAFIRSVSALIRPAAGATSPGIAAHSATRE